MTELFDFDNISLDTHPMYELYFTDNHTVEDSEGLIWKDVLREGSWAYRPGVGQKPIPIPLKVVSGSAIDDTEIGMSDIIDSFEAGAVDHVTVPTSHDDKPHENTGFVRKLKIVDRNGEKALAAGIEFTEPEIKEKALRGSIANTSAGVMFNYKKKDTGKSFSQVLGHVALTNKPWLNGMTPFGVAASENFSDDEIVPLMLESVVWDKQNSFTWIRDAVAGAIRTSFGENFFVQDVGSDRALVCEFDNLGGTENNFVVPFKVQEDSDTVSLAPKEKWIEASQEWVEASEQQMKDFTQNFSDSQESLESANSGAEEENSQEGEIDMAEKDNEGNSGTPSTDSAPEAVTLSEEQRAEILAEAKEQAKAELSEESKAQAEENKKLSKKVRTLTVDKRIDELKADLGEQPGVLKFVREVMLADEGGEILTLSEAPLEGADPVEVKLTASDIVERFLSVLPKKDGKIALGEQHDSTSEGEKPPANPDTSNLSDDERADAFAEDLGLPSEYQRPKDGDE